VTLATCRHGDKKQNPFFLINLINFIIIFFFFVGFPDEKIMTGLLKSR
jgi:hypothetical protein